MNVKKIIILSMICFFALIPMMSKAMSFQDLPPVVIVEGLKNEEYHVKKTIEKDRIIITLEEENKKAYSWSFDRKKIGDELKLNFELNFNSPVKEKIDLKSEENHDKLYLSFSHHGVLPSEATMHIPVNGKYSDGTKLYLYYYNEEDDEIEYIDRGLKVKDGYVEFKIDHCSDYFLTTTIVNDAANNPQSINIIILALIGIVVLLVGVTMFSTKK